MSDIIGKWIQIEGQPYEGLWFNFKPDGTFEAQYDAMGIVSSGNYETDNEKINMDQTAHTFGLVGMFKGIFSIEDNILKMSIAASAGHDRPDTLEDARKYRKEI